MSKPMPKENPYKTDYEPPSKKEPSRQTKWKERVESDLYVIIRPKKSKPRPEVKIVSMFELKDSYDIYDGTHHHKGRTDSDLFLDFMSLMDKWGNVLCISFDAWHLAHRVKRVLLRSESLNPNKPKLEPNYFELKAYTRQGKDIRKAITVLSTANYLGSKEDEFSVSEEDLLLEESVEKTTENMLNFMEKIREEFGNCFDYSTAKIAWNVWRENYLPITIKMPKAVNREMQSVIRGARIQAFGLGYEPYCEQLDFNSLYGYVMENHLFSVEPIIHPLTAGLVGEYNEEKERWYPKYMNNKVMQLPLFPKDVETMLKLVEEGQKKRTEVGEDYEDILMNRIDSNKFFKAMAFVSKGHSLKQALEAVLSPNAQINYRFFTSWSYPERPYRVPNEAHDFKGVLTEFYEGQGWVWGNELKKMHEKGAKITIHSFQAFRSENIFGHFASDFYNKRNESKNKLDRAFYKLMIVGLAGRMAMKRPKRRSTTQGTIRTETGYLQIEELIKAESQRNGKLNLSFNIMDGKGSAGTVHEDFFDITTPTDIRVNLPIVFDEITSYGRDIMFEIMSLVEEEFGEGTTRYTNTDSGVFNKEVTQFLKERNMIGDEIGKLKSQHRGATNIYGINDLTIDDIDTGKLHWVHGGISSEAVVQGDLLKNIRHETMRSPELELPTKSLKKLRNNKSNNKLNYVKDGEGRSYGLPIDSMKVPYERVDLQFPKSGRKSSIIVPKHRRNFNGISTRRDFAEQLSKLQLWNPKWKRFQS